MDFDSPSLIYFFERKTTPERVKCCFDSFQPDGPSGFIIFCRLVKRRSGKNDPNHYRHWAWYLGSHSLPFISFFYSCLIFSFAVLLSRDPWALRLNLQKVHPNFEKDCTPIIKWAIFTCGGTLALARDSRGTYKNAQSIILFEILSKTEALTLVVGQVLVPLPVTPRVCDFKYII